MATKQHLQWLKLVKESHGSVEVSALNQAASINAKGIYRVGFRVATSAPLHKSLEIAIELFLPTDEKVTASSQTEFKRYSYSQLCDVQSKLMLVAGKAEEGAESVERFVEVSCVVNIHILYDGIIVIIATCRYMY